MIKRLLSVFTLLFGLIVVISGLYSVYNFVFDIILGFVKQRSDALFLTVLAMISSIGICAITIQYSIYRQRQKEQ